MGSKPLKMFKVNSLSDVRDIDSLYCVKTSTDTEFTIVVTDAFGNIVNLKDLQTPAGIQGIASDDGTIEVTGVNFKNLRLSATIVNTINNALKAGDNISELVNDAGYLTSFTEIDPIFQASEASLFISGDKSNLDNQSGINTGDETVTSIQSKRPLKTVDSKSLEGAGNIEIDYNTVINKPTSFPPSTHTHTISDVDNLQNELDDKASILHATTHEVNGSDPINGENLSVNVLPPTANYIPFSPTLKGHLQGIDSALGNVVQTTAGITSRVFFTGDLITLGASNFYLSNYGGKGTVTGVSPTPVINDDNQKKYFAQDIISVPFTLPVVAPVGVYSGNLSVRINNDNAQQRYTIEVYRTALDGTPLPSGVSGAPIGNLGVTVLSILDSGLLNLVGGDISSINLSGYLTQEITFNINERLRYRISAEKVGTAGGNITMEVFYGSNYNSYYDVPVIADTNSVLNRSGVVGTTTTNALDSLNAGKANLLGGNNFTGVQSHTEGSNTAYYSMKPIRNQFASFFNQPFFEADQGYTVFRPYLANLPSRFYIMPNGTPTGTTSKFEMFNTDYSADFTSYSAFNILMNNTTNTISMGSNRGSGGGTRQKLRIGGDFVASVFTSNSSAIDFNTDNTININPFGGAVSFGTSNTDPYSLSIDNQFTFRNPSTGEPTRVNINGNGSSAGALYFGRDGVRAANIGMSGATNVLDISLNKTNTGNSLTTYFKILGNTGNLLLADGGSFVDNNKGRLQVDGNITALDATQPEQVTTLSQVNTALALKQNVLTNPVTGTGVSGQVSFWNGTNTQTGDNGLFYDVVNKRLGINTSVPSFMLSVDGANALASFRRNATPITSSPKFLFTRTGATLNTDITAGMQLGGIQFRALTGGVESDYSVFGYFANSTTVGDGVFKFLKSNLTSSVMDINSSNGRIIIQDGGTFADNGVDRVQITGTAISQGWKVTGGLVTQYQTGTGTLVDFNSGVRTAPLTGFTSGAGTVSASDNVLQAIQKLDGNIGSIASSGSYTPTLTSGSNITSLTFNSAFYTKVGNVVTARITVTFSTTVGNTASSFNFSLPLNKTGLTSVSLGNGTSITGASVSNSVDVVSTTSNNIATASFISGAGSGANGKVTVFIMYDITQ